MKKETINIDKKLYMVVSGGAGGVKIENMRIRVGIMLFTTFYIFNIINQAISPIQKTKLKNDHNFKNPKQDAYEEKKAKKGGRARVFCQVSRSPVMRF